MCSKRRNARFASYNGVVEKWKIRLAVSKIRAFKLPKSEWEDALQEIAVAIHEFEFDPAKSNGAKESTAICGLITNLLRNMIRSRLRDQRKTKDYALTLSLEMDPETGEAVDPREQPDAFFSSDFAAVLAQMTQQEREVCVRRARGESQRQVCRAMRLRWERLQQLTMSIRGRLEEAGFGPEGRA